MAVIVAEDITSRFLNIIGLFNGFIPLVALQMNAVKVGENITLIFTKVFDQRVSFGEGEEEIAEVTDRWYWKKRGTKAKVLMADEMLNILKGIDGELELKYNKFYIGMAKSNKPFNFVIFRPKKQYLRVEHKLAQSQQIEEKCYSNLKSELFKPEK